MRMANTIPIPYPHTPITGKAAVKAVPSPVAAGTVHSRQEPMKSAMTRSDRIAYPVRRLIAASALSSNPKSERTLIRPWHLFWTSCFQIFLTCISVKNTRNADTYCIYYLTFCDTYQILCKGQDYDFLRYISIQVLCIVSQAANVSGWTARNGHHLLRNI